jgi:hypothetical protein
LFDAPQIFPDFVVVGPLTDQTAYGLVMAHFEPLCDHSLPVVVRVRSRVASATLRGSPFRAGSNFPFSSHNSNLRKPAATNLPDGSGRPLRLLLTRKEQISVSIVDPREI